MPTKSNIILQDFEQMSAEHEAALIKIRAAAEADERRKLWKKQRLGKFTSSEVYRLMAYEDKNELPKGAITYIEEKVIEILTEGKGTETFYSADMERGNEMELQAVEKFEEETGLTCYATGDDQEFVEFCSYFGGTPDGKSGSEVLIEVKCPKSKTHMYYKRTLKTADDLKKECGNYYWQLQGNLLATGRSTGYFISYDDRYADPKHQLKILEVPRNDADIQKLIKRLQMAEKKKQELLKL